jgi:hypothetical protein
MMSDSSFPDGFKETGIDRVPVDWEVAPLDSLTVCRSEKCRS